MGRPGWRLPGALLALGTLVLSGAGCNAATGHPRPEGSLGTQAAPSTTAQLDLLSGYGATRAAWDAGHQMDPAGTGYWPRLASGYDTYTSVVFVRGRALQYTEHLYPSLAASDAVKVAGDELPPDTRIVERVPSGGPACQLVVESSSTLDALAGVEVLVELHSGGTGYDPASVSTITYRPFAGALTGPAAHPPAC